MEKAYDLGALGDMIKAEGLELAEDGAGKVYKAVKAWFEQSAALSQNKFDDLVIPFLGNVDSVVLPQIDKIDGKQG